MQPVILISTLCHWLQLQTVLTLSVGNVKCYPRWDHSSAYSNIQQEVNWTGVHWNKINFFSKPLHGCSVSHTKISIRIMWTKSSKNIHIYFGSRFPLFISVFLTWAMLKKHHDSYFENLRYSRLFPRLAADRATGSESTESRLFPDRLSPVTRLPRYLYDKPGGSPQRGNNRSVKFPFMSLVRKLRHTPSQNNFSRTARRGSRGPEPEATLGVGAGGDSRGG